MDQAYFTSESQMVEWMEANGFIRQKNTNGDALNTFVRNRDKWTDYWSGHEMITRDRWGGFVSHPGTYNMKFRRVRV